MAENYLDVVLRPLCESDTQAAWDLTRSAGEGNLLAPSFLSTERACAENSGAGALIGDKLIAMCVYRSETIAACLGVRPTPYTVRATLMGQLLVDKCYGGRNIAKHVGWANMGLAYAASDGPRLPVLVGVSFLDAVGGIVVQKKAGMVQVKQNTYLLECDPTLHAVDCMAWAAKERAGSRRPHSVQFLPMANLPTIGKWLFLACGEEGVTDERNAVRYRFRDPSEWSSLEAVWAELGVCNNAMRARLNMKPKGEQKSPANDDREKGAEEPAETSVIHVWRGDLASS